MMNDTPIATLVGFLDALEAHDETAGLWTLLRIPTLIACGDHDLLTPDEYSRKMAASLPNRSWSSSPGPATWRCWTSPTPSTTGWSGWSSGPPRAGRVSADPRMRERFRRRG